MARRRTTRLDARRRRPKLDRRPARPTPYGRRPRPRSIGRASTPTPESARRVPDGPWEEPESTASGAAGRDRRDHRQSSAGRRARADRDAERDGRGHGDALDLEDEWVPNVPALLPASLTAPDGRDPRVDVARDGRHRFATRGCPIAVQAPPATTAVATPSAHPTTTAPRRARRRPALPPVAFVPCRCAHRRRRLACFVCTHPS